jgi:hypothetical protein
MRMILTKTELLHWLSAPRDKAKALRRTPPDGTLKIAE